MMRKRKAARTQPKRMQGLGDKYVGWKGVKDVPNGGYFTASVYLSKDGGPAHTCLFWMDGRKPRRVVVDEQGRIYAERGVDLKITRTLPVTLLCMGKGLD